MSPHKKKDVLITVKLGKCVWFAACSHVEGMLLLLLGQFPKQLTPPFAHARTHVLLPL